MKTSKRRNLRLLPVGFLLFILFSASAFAIDWGQTQGTIQQQPNTVKERTVPQVTGPAQKKVDALSQGPPCEAGSLSTSTAEVLDEVTISGKRLDADCHADFVDSRGKLYPAKNIVINTTSLKVIVPVEAGDACALGCTLRMTAVRPNKEVKSFPFTVSKSVPVLKSLSPTSAYAGDKITVIGGNLRPATPSCQWAVRVRFNDYRQGNPALGDAGVWHNPNDDPFKDVPVTWEYSNWQTYEGKLSFIVPDIYSPVANDSNALASRKNYVKEISILRCNLASNELAMQINDKPVTPPPQPTVHSYLGYTYVKNPSCDADPTQTAYPFGILRSDKDGFFCCSPTTQDTKNRCFSKEAQFTPHCDPEAGEALVLKPWGCYRLNKN